MKSHHIKSVLIKMTTFGQSLHIVNHTSHVIFSFKFADVVHTVELVYSDSVHVGCGR